MKQLTKQEITQETLDFYIVDPAGRRSYDGGCKYNTAFGQHCAVGRCLLLEYHEQGTNLIGNGWLLIDLASKHSSVDAKGIEEGYTGHDELLQEQYRGHEISFWRMLQRLHDFPNHWDFAENNVTKDGIFHIKEMETAFDFKITLPK